jgi:hypothetical protein
MSDELTEYERGFLDGLWAYAWSKDGAVYVGTTGTTYRRAAERFLHEHGHEGWTVKAGPLTEEAPAIS